MLSLAETKRFVQERLGKEKREHAERVSELIRQKELPEETIYAALLHDTLYAEKTTYDELKEKFSQNIADLVRETATIQVVIKRNYAKIPPETLSELILSTTTTLEPIIITLADAADLLKEGEYSEVPFLVHISEEIFSPLAIKLGISGLDWQLQDSLFKIQNPQGYEQVKKMIHKTREEREKLVDTVKKEIEQLLKSHLHVQVYGRPKNFKAIYDKLKKVSFRDMYDIYGIRIICNKEKECYEALGYIHSHYDIIQSAFDDYIAKPKSDGYKSIHTAIKRGGDIIEVQIRTWDQHLRTESSLYWEYKRVRKFKEFEKNLSWERQLIEWQKSLGIGNKKKTVGNKLFTFTPRNDVIVLPVGATTIDFAFAVHTDVGKRMVKAKVNDVLVPIETKLKNLDRVEILAGDKITAKKSWITSVVSDKAKQKLRAHFGVLKSDVKKTKPAVTPFKKIKMADCCHPLPGEDVIGVKTTKRKIIIHKTDCKNLVKIPKNKLVEIAFEKDRGKTEIKVSAVDRIGLLGEILGEVKKSGATLTSTNFAIKKSGYVEALFGIEIASAQKLEHLLTRIEKIPSVHSAQRN